MSAPHLANWYVVGFHVQLQLHSTTTTTGGGPLQQTHVQPHGGEVEGGREAAAAAAVIALQLHFKLKQQQQQQQRLDLTCPRQRAFGQQKWRSEDCHCCGTRGWPATTTTTTMLMMMVMMTNGRLFKMLAAVAAAVAVAVQNGHLGGKDM